MRSIKFLYKLFFQIFTNDINSIYNIIKKKPFTLLFFFIFFKIYLILWKIFIITIFIKILIHPLISYNHTDAINPKNNILILLNQISSLLADEFWKKIKNLSKTSFTLVIAIIPYIFFCFDFGFQRKIFKNKS